MVDLTFKMEEGRFNYRISAVIIHEEKVLAMKDERGPYFYLPGGRVQLFEEAAQAILRELREELFVEAKIVRPLWFCESFFEEEVSNEKFHELCLYYLVDITDTELLTKGSEFTLQEGQHTHRFKWLDIHSLKEQYIYPLFLKDKILDLPKHLEILSITE